MDQNLVEASQTEIQINFALHTKCRASVTLKSLSSTTPIAFKIQTSSPHKFLVSPPTGLIPPLSSATFQVILKPQTHLPPTFPRSPTDRFLIKTAPFNKTASLTSSSDLSSWFASVGHHPCKAAAAAFQDVKLKVAFVGPVLLRHAVSVGDVNTVRNILKRDKSVLKELSLSQGESLLRVAAGFGERMVNLLLEAGLEVDQRQAAAESGSKGWSELHVAVAGDRTEEVVGMVERGFGPLDLRDREGRTALHLAVGRGNVRCARVLVEYGADKDVKSKDGRTPLLRAASNCDRRMVEMLVDLGADPTVADGRGRTAIDAAREKGNVELMQILERGEPVLMAAQKGDPERLEWLLQKGATPNYRDQYGITPIHVAAIKGQRDVLSLLVEYGADLESTDGEGHTPLHLAVEGGCLETVEILVNNGANVNAKSKRDASPVHVAKCLGRDRILRFLVDRGAFSNSSSNDSSLSSSLTSINY